MHPILKRAPTAALAILGFHNITPTFAQPDIVPEFPERFRRLCRLVRSRYDVVTVSEGIRRLSGAEKPARPLLAFIFDDGYADTARQVMPIMRDEGLTGTSYVIVSSVEEGRLPWYEELARLVYRMRPGRLAFRVAGEDLEYTVPEAHSERMVVYWEIVRWMKAHFDPSMHDLVRALQDEHGVRAEAGEARAMMMDRGQLGELLEAGFEVGCHSWSHPILPALDDLDLRHEIVDAKGRLEELVGRPVTSFCYPNGDNDVRCQDLAREAGYECAVSMRCGANLRGSLDTHLLKRAAMSEEISSLWPWKTTYHVHAALVSESPA